MQHWKTNAATDYGEALCLVDPGLSWWCTQWVPAVNGRAW